MTAAKPVLVPAMTVASLLSLLADAKMYTPLHHEAVALIGDLTDALERAEAPESSGSIAAELLQAIALACKVELPTEPTMHALRLAREALAGLSVEAKIIDLPRKPSPDVQRDIAAEVSRQLIEASGVDLAFHIAGRQFCAERRPALPRVGERVVVHDRYYRVADLLHGYAHVVVNLDLLAPASTKDGGSPEPANPCALQAGCDACDHGWLPHPTKMGRIPCQFCCPRI